MCNCRRIPWRLHSPARHEWLRRWRGPAAVADTTASSSSDRSYWTSSEEHGWVTGLLGWSRYREIYTIGCEPQAGLQIHIPLLCMSPTFIYSVTAIPQLYFHPQAERCSPSHHPSCIARVTKKACINYYTAPPALLHLTIDREPHRTNLYTKRNIRELFVTSYSPVAIENKNNYITRQKFIRANKWTK